MESVQAGVTGRKPDSVDPDELVGANEAAKILHQKPQTLAAWRCDKRGPEYVKLGRQIFYRRSSLSAYIATQIIIPAA